MKIGLTEARIQVGHSHLLTELNTRAACGWGIMDG